MDANEPSELRPFWATALGYEAFTTDEGAIDLGDPDGDSPVVWFQRVPETKTIKNRVHLDIWFDDSATAVDLVVELVRLGGAVLGEHEHFTEAGIVPTGIRCSTPHHTPHSLPVMYLI
ncbi:MAG: hypothetical protein GWP04_10680 [Gammaproteobacteria bacterium]|nr:hypothetical protein [Gammaproteobacteria bacterium]